MDEGWWRKPVENIKNIDMHKRKSEIRNQRKELLNRKKLKKERRNLYDKLWRIWWTICTTRIKGRFTKDRSRI